MLSLALLLSWFLPTGPACCDDATDPGSCEPFVWADELGVECDRATIDAELAWCDATAQICVALDPHIGPWRCCSDSRCEWPLGEAHINGDVFVVCDGTLVPIFCDDWKPDGDGWACGSGASLPYASGSTTR